MATYFIVWNEGRSEGFITNDKVDAKGTVSGKPTRHRGYVSCSTAGSAFHEAYDDDKLTIQEIELPEAK